MSDKIDLLNEHPANRPSLANRLFFWRETGDPHIVYCRLDHNSSASKTAEVPTLKVELSHWNNFHPTKPDFMTGTEVIPPGGADAAKWTVKTRPHQTEVTSFQTGSLMRAERLRISTA